MRKIIFTPHAYRKGFGMIADGIAIVAKETVKRVNNAAHQWPYAFMLAEAAVLVMLSFMFIGQARAERDHASKRYTEARNTADSLAITNEMWHNVAKNNN